MKVANYQIHLNRLHKKFDGYKILQISDMHIGRRERESQVIDTLRKLEADLVVVTGDIIHEKKFYSRGEDFFDAMVKAISPTDGFLGVWGNHECELSGEVFRQFPIRWISNSAYKITRSAGVINFVGLDQRYYSKMDIIDSLAEVDCDGVIIVLCHFPSTAMLLNGIIDLVISGHTHAGQVVIPGLPFMTNDDIFWRDGKGLSQIGGTQLLVSAGVGYSGPVSIRFNAPSELVMIELVVGN